MSMNSFPHESFKDALAANDEYIKTFKYSDLTGTAQRGLAIVTCMDSRINPLSVVGMKSGVERILIMPHTNCRMAQVDDVEIHREIDTKYGIDTSEIEFKTVPDQQQALIEDVQKVRSYRLINKDVVVGGAIYDVATGKITPVDC